MMAEVDEARPCIKLFGTVILKEGKKQRKEEPGVATAPAPALDATAALETVEEATARAAAAAALPCPRCKSKETKFCYFNNYNVNQPRHFCKACHRYWTAGGTLRNVPVGAGRRRGRPSAARVGGGGGPAAVGSVSGGGVLEYGAQAGADGQQRWLLRPDGPMAGSDGRFDAGFR